MKKYIIGGALLLTIALLIGLNIKLKNLKSELEQIEFSNNNYINNIETVVLDNDNYEKYVTSLNLVKDSIDYDYDVKYLTGVEKSYGFVSEKNVEEVDFSLPLAEGELLNYYTINSSYNINENEIKDFTSFLVELRDSERFVSIKDFNLVKNKIEKNDKNVEVKKEEDKDVDKEIKDCTITISYNFYYYLTN